MPIIQCDIREGRDQAQKRELARRIADAVHETIGSPREYIYVLIRETPGHQHFHGGEFLPEYGAPAGSQTHPSP